MKTVGIMQPYFLPYIGYWQLIAAVDEFVVYDNVEFTKKGWFNRNRIIDIDDARLFTIPIKKDSDYLNVVERSLADDVRKENARTMRIIEATYKKAPHYDEIYPLIENCFSYDDDNLFNYIYHAIQTISSFLEINTKLIVASMVPADHSLKAAARVMAICKALEAKTYINSIGGIELYDSSVFSSNELELKFIKPKLVAYNQFGGEFIPGLSIIDVLMFNGKTGTQRLLHEYELI